MGASLALLFMPDKPQGSPDPHDRIHAGGAMSTPIDRAALRALAKKATPGPWRYWLGGPIDQMTDCGKGYALDVYPDSKPIVLDRFTVEQDSVRPIPRDEDAEFIAACSPDVVLALLDALERAEAALSSINAAHRGRGGESCPDESGECSICGVLDCPYGDPFHYHHDGCPSEYVAEKQAAALLAPLVPPPAEGKP
jgi:hypothetical protein